MAGRIEGIYTLAGVKTTFLYMYLFVVTLRTPFWMTRSTANAGAMKQVPSVQSRFIGVGDTLDRADTPRRRILEMHPIHG